MTAQRPKVLVLASSPRRDGNSALLAKAVAEGAREAGHDVSEVDLNDHVAAALRDCRTCRGGDGLCTVDDGYLAVLDRMLAADAVVYATPIYWYGMSGLLKTFIDRIFCYISASYPDTERVRAQLPGKRAALVLASEESYPGAELGIVAQMQEFCRYLHHELVGVVRGVGNSRGEVRYDPADPLGQASRLGQSLLVRRSTDFRLDTPRDRQVWPPAHDPQRV